MRLITTVEAARILGRHPNTITQWRMWNHGPSFVRKGGRVWYTRAEVRRWKRQQLVKDS